MSVQERLKDVHVDKFNLETEELIIAQMVKAYLYGLSEEDALDVMREMIEGTMIQIPGEGEDRIVAEGEKLAALIDAAKVCIMERVRAAEWKTQEAEEIRDIVLKAIAGFDGKEIAENISLPFLGFLVECYQDLRAEKKVD